MRNCIVLDRDTPSVQYLCKHDKRLAKVISMIGPIRYTPNNDDSYTFLVHEIIEQMLSVKAGRKIFNRLEILCNGKIVPQQVSLLSDMQMREVGISRAKIEYIRGLTKAINERKINIDNLTNLSDDDVINELTMIRGIGNWTAKMYLIFMLNRPDVLPLEDGAFLQVYRWLYKTDDCSKTTISKKCKKWKPYSSIAARFCYKALDQGLTKNEFNLFK